MSSFAGNVDALSRAGLLEGWALDTLNPATTLRLNLLLDDEVAGEFSCVGSRPDVRAAGYATDIVGFSHLIHMRFHDDVERTVSFRSAQGGEAFQLNGLRTVRLAKPPSGEVRMSPERDRLVGWVTDTSTKRRPVYLEVRINGEPFTIESLRGSAETADRIEFSIPLPAEISEDSRVGVIEVMLLGSSDHLVGSPMASRVSKTIGAFDDLRGGMIIGWAFDVGLRRSPLLDVFCDDVKIMEIQCNSAREDIFKMLGVRAAGFQVQLPTMLLGPSPNKIHIQFPDGSPLPGGPKHFQVLDLELVALERKLFSQQVTGGEVMPASVEDFEGEIALLGRMLVAPPRTAEVARYRPRAVELAYEILDRALFSLSPANAMDVAIKLALLGINICRTSEDFQNILPVMQRLPKNSPQAYGLIELERQRRRPFNRLMLAGILLAHDREDEAIDIIFDDYASASEKDRNSLVLLGAGMLVRAGKAGEAQDLLLAHLVK